MKLPFLPGCHCNPARDVDDSSICTAIRLCVAVTPVALTNRRSQNCSRPIVRAACPGSNRDESSELSDLRPARHWPTTHISLSVAGRGITSLSNNRTSAMNARGLMWPLTENVPHCCSFMHFSSLRSRTLTAMQRSTRNTGSSGSNE